MAFTQYVNYTRLVTTDNSIQPDNTQNSDDEAASASASMDTTQSPSPPFELFQADKYLKGLALQRRHHYPVQYFFILPILRSFSMWFTPRAEFISDNLPWLSPVTMITLYVPSILFFIYYLGVWNLLLLFFAVTGMYKILRTVKQWRWEILTIIVLIISRTLFFAYFAFPEQRYMLELYPLVIVFASFSLMNIFNLFHEQ